ncbi:MAG: hypothetical protein M1836_004151 [Candelina mexicana]|nr:MAG: hypothetical protein M1836_004151 [Candelina mexicana]
MAAMTAVGTDEPTKSWQESQIASQRYCGSVYASAVIGSLYKLEESERERMTEIQSRTYGELQELVRDTLVNGFDRRGDAHDISFSAQDDICSMEWEERTGIQLAHYRARWAALNVIPFDNRAHPLSNRDPKMSALADQVGNTPFKACEEQRDPSEPTDPKWGNEAALCGRTGGSMSGMQGLVRQMAKEYVASSPGRDSWSTNISLHSSIKELLGGEELTPSELHVMHSRLEYRLGIMKRADQYRALCGLEFASCNDWDRTTWEGLARNNDRFGRYEKIQGMLEDAMILAYWAPGAGAVYNKGRNYLAAALTESGLDRESVEQKVSMLKSCDSDTIDRLIKLVKGDREVRNKAQEFFSTMGKNDSFLVADQAAFTRRRI